MQILQGIQNFLALYLPNLTPFCFAFSLRRNKVYMPGRLPYPRKLYLLRNYHSVRKFR